MTITHSLSLRSCLLLPLILGLAACHQQTPAPPGFKVGKPYSIDGKTYYPEYDPTYDKIGEASWYGPGFHGKYTASGDVYDQNDLTAAHPTLPMPTLVRVTNLTNGHSLIVRINDRGPFKSNRIIDLSKKAAQELGITSTAKVRVQFLQKETSEYVASLQAPGTKADMVAYNAQAEQVRDSSILHSTEPAGQIVESTVSNTHAGQSINDAAPIMTVDSGELNKPRDKASARKAAYANPDSYPKSGSSVVHEAYAEDTTVKALPAPDKNVDTSQQAVLSTKTTSTGPGQPVALDVSKPPLFSMHNDDPPVKTSTRTPPVRDKVKAVMAGKAPNIFYIQAGSFSTEVNANKLSSKLNGMGDIDVAKIEMGDKTWWRVRLGPFEDQQSADAALDKVHAAGLPDARVVHQ